MSFERFSELKKEMKIPYFTILLFTIILHSCITEDNKEILSITEDYYHTFNQRKDFEKFIAFYSEDIILEDIVNGDRIIGKSELRRFFDWDNPSFESLDINTLIITEKIIQHNKSVLKGYFSKFRWGQAEFESMHFTTILRFSDSGKIIKQVDWINYPATLVDYENRKNSNNWIK